MLPANYIPAPRHAAAVRQMNVHRFPYLNVTSGMEVAEPTAYDGVILVFIRCHPLRAGAFRAFLHGC